MNGGDLTRRLCHGEVFQTDAGRVKIHCRHIGDVVIVSGRMVMCSPEACGLAGGVSSFEPVLSAGRYPVILALAEQADGTWIVASASVRLTDRLPVSWEVAPLAIYSEHAELDAFMDAEAEKVFGDMMLANETKTWHDMLRALEENSQGYISWANILLDERTGLNLIVWANGGDVGSRGNGTGLDAEGRRVCITSFYQLPSDPGELWNPFA